MGLRFTRALGHLYPLQVPPPISSAGALDLTIKYVSPSCHSFVQDNGFQVAHGSISILLGGPGSKWTMEKVRQLLCKADPQEEEYNQILCGAPDKPKDQEVLKIVFNGQHRQQAALRVDAIEKLPCGIWCRLHPSLARWMGTKLNVVAGKQLASTTLEKYQVIFS